MHFCGRNETVRVHEKANCACLEGQRWDPNQPRLVLMLERIRFLQQWVLYHSFSTVIPTLASSLPNHSPLSALIHASKPPPPPPPTLDSRGRRRFTLTTAAGSNLPVCEVHHRGLLVRISWSQFFLRSLPFRGRSVDYLGSFFFFQI